MSLSNSEIKSSLKINGFKSTVELIMVNNKCKRNEAIEIIDTVGAQMVSEDGLYGTHNIVPKRETILACPKCKSTSIAIGQRGFKITTGFLGSNKTVNRCGNCGYTWQPKK